jgi:hypothetical protein
MIIRHSTREDYKAGKLDDLIERLMKTLTQAGRSRFANWFWIGPHDEYERLIG